VWAVLAEKLSGDKSVTLFSEDCCATLFNLLQDNGLPLIQIHALIALEKFAMTSKGLPFLHRVSGLAPQLKISNRR